MTLKQNARLYTRRMLLASLVYTVLTVFSGYMTRQLPEGDAWRIVLALLPVLPAVGMVLAILAFVRGLDELEQRIHLISAVITLSLIIVAGITCGFLQAYAGLPDLSAFWFGIGGIAGWSLVHPIVRRTYA